MESASEIVGRNLTPGTIVVYESTVYPGVTEDVCIPILERESGLVCGRDFKIGYSPERINPGDRVHRLENIRKIVSGMDADSLEEIRRVYDLVIEVGTYPVSSIKTAEAVKVVEVLNRCPIKAIWNFAHCELEVREDIQVENVHLSDSLMQLSYQIRQYELRHKAGEESPKETKS